MSDNIYNPPTYMHNTWRMDQIYVSTDTANGIVSGGVVPNIDDTVIEWSGNIKYEYRVVKVNVDNTSVLEAVEYPTAGNEIVLGIPVGVGNLTNVANLYLNPVDEELSAVIDARLPIYGVDLSYVRLFKGTDITNTGVIVSVRYDENGDVIDDKVPLVLATTTDNDRLRYSVRPLNLTNILDEDTVVIAVFYNDNDTMAMYQELVVKHSHIVANVQNQSLFITRIYLDSVYLNPADETQLLIPKNLLNSSFTPRLFKEYQTGQREELILGGSNVSLMGWGDYISGEVGERFPLVMSYILGTGELSNNVDTYSGTHMTQTYEVIIIDTDTDTDVKLFVLPEFVGSSVGYALKYYLYSANREFAEEVTDKVTQSSFRPLTYKLKQQIDVSIDLSNFDDLPDMIYSQSFDVMLMGAPLANSTQHRLWYYRGDVLYYGDNLRAKLMSTYGTYTIALQNGYTSKDAWLDALFYAACPLYDPLVVAEAPQPTHVDIIVGDVTLVFNVDNFWDGEIAWTESIPDYGSNVILKWYKYSGTGTRLDLAITNMPLEVI